MPLTKTEYEILIYLFQNSNHVLTHSQIYERIWREPDYGEARKLVSHRQPGVYATVQIHIFSRFRRCSSHRK
ncbi:MAG: helix-turn-helix domain-containing protein [Acutalibacter sp.]